MILKLGLKMVSLATFNASRVALSHFFHWFCIQRHITLSPSLPLTLLPPSYKDPYKDTGPTQIVQDNLLTLNSLIISPKPFLPCKVTHSDSRDRSCLLWGAGMWEPRGGRLREVSRVLVIFCLDMGSDYESELILWLFIELWFVYFSVWMLNFNNKFEQIKPTD